MNKHPIPSALTVLLAAVIGFSGDAVSETRRWPLLSSIATNAGDVRLGQVVGGECVDDGCFLPQAYRISCLPEGRFACEGKFEVKIGSHLRVGARYIFVSYRSGDRQVLLPFELKFHDEVGDWVVVYDGSYVPDVLKVERVGGVREEFFGYFRLGDFERLLSKSDGAS